MNLNFDEIFEAYYTLYRADYDVPASGDDEYKIAMRMANEAVNYWANYEGVYWEELFDTNRTDGSGTQTLSTGVTSYNAPSNFREAGGFVKILDSDSNEVARYTIIKPNEVQFKGDSDYCYFTSSPIYYSVGTASQTAYTITGAGTTWTSAMVGMEFKFATGESATITAFVGVTELTCSVSQTVAPTTYNIVKRGYKLHINPAPTSALNGKYIEYPYYKYPTNFTTGTSTTEMSNPYFIVHRMLAQQFRSSRNPYYSSALRDSENAIKLMQLDNASGSWDNPPTIADNSEMTFGG